MYFKCFESINLWGSDNSSSISIQRRQKWMTCEHSNNFMLWNPRIICGYGVLNNTNRKIWTTCIDGWWCLHIISIYSSSSVWLNNRAHSQFVLTLVIVFHFFFSSACSVSTIMPNKHRLHLSHVKQFVCFSFFSLSFWGLHWSVPFFPRIYGIFVHCFNSCLHFFGCVWTLYKFLWRSSTFSFWQYYINTTCNHKIHHTTPPPKPLAKVKDIVKWKVMLLLLLLLLVFFYSLFTPF